MKNSFDIFMSKNYQMFFWYCNHTKDQTAADADEIVGEAFCRLHFVWSQRKDCDDRSNKKWMYHTIDYIVKEFNRDRKKHYAENIDDYSESITDTLSVEDSLLDREYVETLERELRDTDRELFRMVYIKNIAYADIRHQLNISDQALRTRISRLRDRIKNILKK